MSKVTFFLKEAMRSVQRNGIPSFAALMSILVTVLVLGVFIPITQATTGAANEVRDRVLVNVYLDRDATKADRERIAKRLEDTKYVGNVEFVSKQEAYKREQQRNPEAYELLGSNPLPDTFRVQPDEPGNALKLRDELSPVTPSGSRTVVDPAIESVKSQRDETKKLLTVTTIVIVAMATLAGLLAIASILLITNTIRLSLFSRRREVEVMKLVGATDWFIRWPFVLEGIVLGLMGGTLAILLLAVGKIALLDPLAADFALISSPETMPFWLLAGLLLVASVAVSAGGSALSLRRFLKV